MRELQEQKNRRRDDIDENYTYTHIDYYCLLRRVISRVFIFFFRLTSPIPIHRISAHAKYIYAMYYLNDDTPLHAFYDDTVVYTYITLYFIYNECIRVYRCTSYGTNSYVSTPPFFIGLSRIIFCQDVVSV